VTRCRARWTGTTEFGEATRVAAATLTAALRKLAGVQERAAGNDRRFCAGLAIGIRRMLFFILGRCEPL
jgi:hypothetical protein